MFFRVICSFTDLMLVQSSFKVYGASDIIAIVGAK